MREILIIGAGSSMELRISPSGKETDETLITTLDVEPRHKTDIVWDLNRTPWPPMDNSYDEIHAYEVLEHLGQQGDHKSFFAHFSEIYRILRPGGHLLGSVPRWDGVWAWGDPSHRRVITEKTFVYLDLPQYERQVGKTAMTDFRSVWAGDFELLGVNDTADQMYFALKAHKPVRGSANG